MPGNFLDFIDQLSARLRDPLPGDKAHDLMMPIGRSSEIRRIMENSLDDIKEGGVLLLLFPRDNKISFPLMLRPDYPGVHARQISLPGGRREVYDKDLIETALRETEEEIGVEVSSIKVIGKLSSIFIPPSRYRIEPTVAYVDTIPDFQLDPREVEELILADITHITGKEYRKKKNIEIRGAYSMNTPYFDIHNHVVWGATGMILSEFAHIVEELV